jgi:Ca2+-binding RTX toxin-like protein
MGDGNDTLNIDDKGAEINAGLGNDIINITMNNFIVEGGNGTDSGNLQIRDLVVNGDGGNDTIHLLKNYKPLGLPPGFEGGFGATSGRSISGGSGADTFVFYNIEDANSSFITDFSLAENDVLDISRLLVGYDPLIHALNDFVQLQDTGFNTRVRIDADGGADGFINYISLNGTTGLGDADTLEASGNIIA